MKLSHEAVLELMALADGELAESERARVEKLVADDEDARRLVESIRRPDLGDWLAEGLDARAAAAGADAIADAVMGRIAQDGVVRLNDARKRRPVRSSRLEFMIGGGVAALALAAGVALYAHSQGAPADAPMASVGAPPVDFQPPSALANAGANAGVVSNGVELDEIDAPQRGVSVFEIPVSAAAAMANPSHGSSIVVWVDEEPAAK